jgi:DNA helicase II / ATP-dependent DNA helicase PcrA
MEARTRMENVQELLSVTEQFQSSTESPTITAFLEQVALISDIDTLDESGNAITLMTLHSAKGLEFPVVYIVGMEEGLFPHRRSLEDREELAEERRLCYVGMTRAKEELTFAYAHQRMLMGQVTGSDVSRFIREIPEEVMADTLPRRRRASADTQWRRDFQPRRTSSTATYRPAQKVFHEQFGQGIVLNCSGSGPEEVVTVAFEGNGVKKLQVSLANLRKA